MTREELINRMTDCFNSCKIMRYSDKQAMDRVLEVLEEELKFKINYAKTTAEKEYYNRYGYPEEKKDSENSDEDPDDDNYCGAV